MTAHFDADFDFLADLFVTEADADGRYAVNVPSGARFTPKILLEDFASSSGPVEVKSDVVADIHLERLNPKGRPAPDEVVAWVKQKASDLLAPFTGLGARIKGALGLGGGAAAPSGVTASPGDAAAMSGSVDAAKAAGGPVNRGRTYLVGERGPEIFKPATGGTVIPNKALGGGTTIAPTFNIAINGNADARTVENIRRVLRDEVRQAFRGVYADAGMRFA